MRKPNKVIATLPTGGRSNWDDNGAGPGASHQTGWTGLAAKLIQFVGLLDGPKLLEAGKATAFLKAGENIIVGGRGAEGVTFN